MDDTMVEAGGFLNNLMAEALTRNEASESHETSAPNGSENDLESEEVVDDLRANPDIICYKIKADYFGDTSRGCTIESCCCNEQAVMDNLKLFSEAIANFAKCRMKMCPFTVKEYLCDKETFGIYFRWLEFGNFNEGSEDEHPRDQTGDDMDPHGGSQSSILVPRSHGHDSDLKKTTSKEASTVAPNPLESTAGVSSSSLPSLSPVSLVGTPCQDENLPPNSEASATTSPSVRPPSRDNEGEGEKLVAILVKTRSVCRELAMHEQSQRESNNENEENSADGAHHHAEETIEDERLTFHGPASPLVSSDCQSSAKEANMIQDDGIQDFVNTLPLPNNEDQENNADGACHQNEVVFDGVDLGERAVPMSTPLPDSDVVASSDFQSNTNGRNTNIKTPDATDPSKPKKRIQKRDNQSEGKPKRARRTPYSVKVGRRAAALDACRKIKNCIDSKDTSPCSSENKSSPVVKKHSPIIQNELRTPVVKRPKEKPKSGKGKKNKSPNSASKGPLPKRLMFTDKKDVNKNDSASNSNQKPKGSSVTPKSSTSNNAKKTRKQTDSKTVKGQANSEPELIDIASDDEAPPEAISVVARMLMSKPGTRSSVCDYTSDDSYASDSPVIERLAKRLKKRSFSKRKTPK